MAPSLVPSLPLRGTREPSSFVPSLPLRGTRELSSPPPCGDSDRPLAGTRLAPSLVPLTGNSACGLGPNPGGLTERIFDSFRPFKRDIEPLNYVEYYSKLSCINKYLIKI
jgi:hypothetical protein